MAEVTQWARDIYDKYDPSFSILETQHLLNYFVELCEKQGIDPQLIDLDEEIDWDLTYYECREQVKELVGGIDEEAMTEMWITNQLKAATSVLEGTEHEIVESKTLERLERAARRLEKIQAREKALKRKLEELQRKEAEREEEERRRRARLPPPPPIVERGLSAENEKELEDEFKAELLKRGVSISRVRGYMPLFRDEMRNWKRDPDIAKSERSAAFRLAKSLLIGPGGLIEEVIAIAPPPRRVPPPRVVRPPPAVIRIELPEEKPREATYETRYCWVGDEAFTHDVDLEMRLRKPVMRGRFAADVPALDLPERFYHLCSEHKMEKYSYFSMIDAVAYRLADRSKQNIGFTVTTLRGLGLTPDDISSIVNRAVDYGYKHQSTSSSSYAVP